MTEPRDLVEPVSGRGVDADDVAAPWPLRWARMLYQTNRLPEWLYKAFLKLVPGNWFPEPQSYVLYADIDGRAVSLLHRTNDTLGREAWLFGYYDRLVLTFLRRVAKRLKSIQEAPLTFYDVGANIGNHTVFLADLFDEVYCFEPNPKAIEILEINVGPLPNVRIFPVGLSDQDAELGFMTGSARNLGNAHIVAPEEGPTPSVRIAVRAGDGIVREDKLAPPALLKIDVEGHEAQVIEGLEETIAEHTPVIVVEILERALEKAGPVADLLRTRGYRVFRMSGLDRARQLFSFRNRLVLEPYDFDGPCENALAIPPRYWGVLRDLVE